MKRISHKCTTALQKPGPCNITLHDPTPKKLADCREVTVRLTGNLLEIQHRTSRAMNTLQKYSSEIEVHNVEV